MLDELSFYHQDLLEQITIWTSIWMVSSGYTIYIIYKSEEMPIC
jgi:hypothetical protein